MKINIAISASLVVLALSAGCATTSTIPENPISVEMEPMELPPQVARRFHQLNKLDNSENYYEVTGFDSDGSHSGRNNKGCSWKSPQNLVSPPNSWNDCTSDPEWVNGENRDMTQKGSLWPLVVGNEASYRFTQFNAYGKSTGKKTRKCKVLSQVNIDVAAGNFDTYKVRCTRKQGDWSRTQVWYFSPEMQASVKYIDRSSSKGIERDNELSRIELL